MHRLSLILWKTQDIQYTERGWDGILSLSAFCPPCLGVRFGQTLTSVDCYVSAHIPFLCACLNAWSFLVVSPSFYN